MSNSVVNPYAFGVVGGGGGGGYSGPADTDVPISAVYLYAHFNEAVPQWYGTLAERYSVTNRALTKTGGVTRDTANKKFGDAALSLPDSGAQYLDSGSILIEDSVVYGGSEWMYDIWARCTSTPPANGSVLLSIRMATNDGYASPWQVCFRIGIGQNLSTYAQISASAANATNASGGTWLNIAVSAASKVVLNTYHHYRVAKKGGYLSFWFDGEKIGQVAAPVGVSIGSRTRLLIGSHYFGYDLENFVGQVDSFRIATICPFDTSLTNFNPPTKELGIDYNTDSEYVDKYLSQVVFLHNFNGVNGDSVPAPEVGGAATITGAPVLSSAQMVNGSTSLYLNGSSALRYDATPTVSWAFNRPFTLECWFYRPNSTTAGVLVTVDGLAATHAGHSLWIRSAADGDQYKVELTLSKQSAQTTYIVTLRSRVPPEPGKWHHVAAVMNGVHAALIMNGVVEDSKWVDWDPFTTVTAPAGRYVHIGAYYNLSSFFTGYIDSVRFTQGTPRYLFDYPAVPYPNIPFMDSGNTVRTTDLTDATRHYFSIQWADSPILIHGSRASGMTTGDRTITLTSASVSTSKSKFGTCLDLTAASSYAASATGLVETTFWDNKEWTIEMWAKPTDDSTGGNLLRVRSSGGGTVYTTDIAFHLAYDSSGFSIGLHGAAAYHFSGTNSLPCPIGRWYHVAVSFYNGVANLFVNGKLSAWIAKPSDFSAASKTTVSIGSASNNSSVDKFYGYIDDIRFSTTALYKAPNLCPVYSFPVAEGNPDPMYHQVTTLLRFPNGSLPTLDSKYAESFTTDQGTPTLSQAEFKYGNASLRNPSSGGSVRQSSTSQDAYDRARFEDEPYWTMEMWVKRDDASRLQTLGGRRDSGPGRGYGIRLASDNKLLFYFGGTGPMSITSTSTVTSTTVWQHLVAMRCGKNLFLFINGRLDASVTTNWGVTGVLNSKQLRVGTNPPDYILATECFYGYMDDFRITMSARYGGNPFTVPTRQLTRDEHTRLLMLFEGANGSTAFTDNSEYARTVTTMGNAQHTTSHAAFGASSYSGDGTGDGLSIASDALFNFNYGDFTYELFFKCSSAQTSKRLITRRNSGSGVADADYQLSVYFDGSNNLTALFVPQGAAAVGLGGVASSRYADSKWHHVVLQREADNYTFWFDGELEDRKYSTAQLNNLSCPVYIGKLSDTLDQSFNGYIDCLRISACARYDGPKHFAVPKRAAGNHYDLVNDPLQPSTIFYLSGRGLAGQKIVAEVGTALEVMGGGTAPTYNNTNFRFESSVQFAGSGYLRMRMGPMANWAVTNEHTLEFWFRPSIVNANSVILSWDGSVGVHGSHHVQLTSGGKLALAYRPTSDPAAGSVQLTTVTGLVADTWYHVAIVYRRNGRSSTVTQLTLYLNGKNEAMVDLAATNLVEPTAEARYFNVGAYLDGTLPFTGYLENVRLTRGERYTSEFVIPPTTMPSVARVWQNDRHYEKVALLVQGYGSLSLPYHIRDMSRYQAIGAVSGAGCQLSNDTAKFHPLSLRMANLNDGLLFSNDNGKFDLLDKDFTIESWVYFSNNFACYIAGQVASSGQDPTGSFAIRKNGSNFLEAWVIVQSTAYTVTGATTITLNQWYHVALSRDGTSLRLFLNGVLQGTQTLPAGAYVNSCKSHFGVGRIGEFNSALGGYIDDFRVTIGVARYTAGFSVPTDRLPHDLALFDGSSVDRLRHMTRFFSNMNAAPPVDSVGRHTISSVGTITSATGGYFGNAVRKISGTGNYLSVTGANLSDFVFGTEFFTLEGRVKFNTTSADIGLCGFVVNGSFDVRIVSNTLRVGRVNTGWDYTSSSITLTSGATGTWHWWVVQRSPDGFSLYWDGVRVLHNTGGAINYSTSNTVFRIGLGGDSPGIDSDCWIDEFRLTRHPRYYGSTISPPAVPYTF